MSTPEAQPEGVPARSLRASDADRHAAAETLRDAAGDGRLDLSELDERLDLVYRARTRAELTPLLADLVPAAPAASSAEPLVLETRSGTVKRMGHWVAPGRIVARSTSGTVKLDFTEAARPAGDVTVEAETRSGAIVLIVPRGWHVRIESASTHSGSVTNKAIDPPQAGAPTLYVHGTVRSGTVKVRYPYRTRKR